MLFQRGDLSSNPTLKIATNLSLQHRSEQTNPSLKTLLNIKCIQLFHYKTFYSVNDSHFLFGMTTWSANILTIIKRETGKLKTQSLIYCKIYNGGKELNHTRQNIKVTNGLSSQPLSIYTDIIHIYIVLHKFILETQVGTDMVVADAIVLCASTFLIHVGQQGGGVGSTTTPCGLDHSWSYAMLLRGNWYCWHCTGFYDEEKSHFFLLL